MKRSVGSVAVAVTFLLAGVAFAAGVPAIGVAQFTEDIKHRVDKLKHARTLDALSAIPSGGQCGVSQLVVVHGGPEPDIQNVRSKAPPLAKFATEDVEFVHVSRAACLSTVTSIPGDMLIYDNGELGDIDFLVNLRSVGGHLLIYGDFLPVAPQIDSLAGLQNLQSIGGSLNIVNMREIQNLVGLGNLVELGADLLVWNNAKLRNFAGIGPLVQIVKTFYLDNNPSMIDLTGLENIQEIGFDVLLKGNRQLSDLSALANLNTVWNSIMIQNMKALTDLSFLSRLERLGNSIDIYEVPLLRDLTGLELLTEIKGDLILTANSLESVRGLENVQAIDMNLIISQDTALNDLSAFRNVRRVGGLISILDNKALQTCVGLENVAETGNDVVVQRNDALVTLEGLAMEIVGTQLGGNIIIQDNPLLTSLGALPQTLREVRGGVRIVGNSLSLPPVEINAVLSVALQ